MARGAVDAERVAALAMECILAEEPCPQRGRILSRFLNAYNDLRRIKREGNGHAHQPSQVGPDRYDFCSFSGDGAWIDPELTELSRYVPGWRVCYVHGRGADIQQHELDEPIRWRSFRQWCFDLAERLPSFPFWVLASEPDSWAFYGQLAGTDKSLIVELFCLHAEGKQGPERPGRLRPEALTETLPLPSPDRVRMDLDRLRFLLPAGFVLEAAAWGEVRDRDSGKLLAGPCELFSFQARCDKAPREA